jgi:hypothetical protein
MRPIQLGVFLDYGPTDPRQVPASSATVAAYKQGATVLETTSCSAHAATQVSVANSGRLELGDLVSVVGRDANLLVVGSVTSDGRTLTLANSGGSAVVLEPGDRLLVTGEPFLVVAEETLLPHDSATDVAVRMFRPALYATLYPNGDMSRPLTVDASPENETSLLLGNDSQYHDNITLVVGDLLTSDTGEVLAVVSADAVCYDGMDTEVEVALPMAQPPAALCVNLDPSQPLAFGGVSDNGLVVTVLNSGDALTLEVGDRLCPPPVATFKDASGVVSNLDLALDEHGELVFHTPETRVDCVVAEGGLSEPRLLVDQMGGWVRGGAGSLNAKDYPSIQAAIDALPAEGGDRLHPRGDLSPSGDPLHALRPAVSSYRRGRNGSWAWRDCAPVGALVRHRSGNVASAWRRIWLAEPDALECGDINAIRN